ncbi:DotG/IcmE/VirB10 family protein [Vibrio alginolyticus]
MKLKKIAIVVGLFVVAAGGIGYAIYMASNQVTEDLSGKGDKTAGRPVVKTDDVIKNSIDGTISVPENSPIAKETEEREKNARKQAATNGESHISKTRVQESATEPDTKTEVDKPKSQEVDPLGQEVKSGKDAESKKTNSDTEENSAGRDVKLPLPKQDIETSSQLEDLRNELATTKMSLKAQEIKNRNDKADAERQRLIQLEAERQKKISEGAQALFSGLPYAPDTGEKYKITYSKKADIYSKTSQFVFDPSDAEQEVASALYRSDGGQTQMGVHPNYYKKENTVGYTDNEKETSNEKYRQPPVEVDQESIVFDAGELVYARTTLPIDSDIPGPIRIRLLTGKAEGSIAFGEMELIEQAPGVALTVTSVIRDGKQIPVKAWVLSAETEKALIEGEVDHHYIQRFGGMFAGLFMTGFLDSLIDTTVTTSNGETTTSTGAIDNTRDRIVYSIAKAAQGFLPILYDNARRPVQVEIPKGQTMYLLFENQVLETDEIQTPNQSDLLKMMEEQNRLTDVNSEETDLSSEIRKSNNGQNVSIPSDNKTRLWN